MGGRRGPEAGRHTREYTEPRLGTRSLGPRCLGTRSLGTRNRHPHLAVSRTTNRGEALVQRRRRGPAPSRTSHSTTSRPLRDPRILDTKSLLSWASHDELSILMTLQHTQLDEPQAACVPSGLILPVSVKRRVTKPGDHEASGHETSSSQCTGPMGGWSGAGGGGTRSLCPEPRNLDPRLAEETRKRTDLFRVATDGPW